MGTQITGGVDTHLAVHVAAALDERGALLGTASFATTPAGYHSLVGWFASVGEVVVIGVEGTGSYGAGLTRHLQGLGIAVVDVDRPNRQRRRRQGKSDTHDAISAARAAVAGDALGAPLDASTGKQQRHRLNRGGDRQANSALWRIVITRLSYDPATRRYLQRRCTESKTKTEAIRCLKRFIARDLYAYLPPETLA